MIGPPPRTRFRKRSGVTRRFSYTHNMQLLALRPTLPQIPVGAPYRRLRKREMREARMRAPVTFMRHVASARLTPNAWAMSSSDCPVRAAV
jgi:hypothetical protein